MRINPDDRLRLRHAKDTGRQRVWKGKLKPVEHGRMRSRTDGKTDSLHLQGGAREYADWGAEADFAGVDYFPIDATEIVVPRGGRIDET